MRPYKSLPVSFVRPFGYSSHRLALEELVSGTTLDAWGLDVVFLVGLVSWLNGGSVGGEGLGDEALLLGADRLVATAHTYDGTLAEVGIELRLYLSLLG